MKQATHHSGFSGYNKSKHKSKSSADELLATNLAVKHTNNNLIADMTLI